MDIELLRTFIAVVDNGSFTRAAAQIYRSQSAISMQVKRLEEQLQRQLFHRSARNLKLSLDGRALLPYARQLLKLHDEAMDNILNRSQAHNIRIGCPDDYSHTLLPDLIQILRRKIPGVHISSICANSNILRQHLDNGELDMTIITRPEGSTEGVLILQEQGVWLCNDPQMINRRPLPLALLEPGCKFHSLVIDGLQKADISYDLVCDASNCGLLIELVRRNLAVSVMAAHTAPDDMVKLTAPEGLPTLPVAEIVICLKGGKQLIEGISLETIAAEMTSS
ncbi:MAG: LysR family transcriptional regulator [Pseudomonadales bacterium]|nr:LysR family transcriptional regulator [Pseudomonadales bacterium]NRA15429.1 LysR family transcriptional regulator [Oceanospirillaceae bacterium]